MKVKFNFNKRTNIYVTLLACLSGLWLLVTRFGLSWDEILKYLWVSVVLLLGICALALPFGLLFMWLNARNNRD